MASLVSNLTEQARTNMDSRTNVELKGEPFKTFKFKTDNFTIQHQATVFEQKNIGGDVLIYGNDSFGNWGSFKWGDSSSQSFILGLSKLGINSLGDSASAFEIVRISPPNNTFNESFISDYFIDSTSTTATREVNLVTF